MYIDQFVCLFFYTRGRPHRLLHILHFSTPSPHRLLHKAFSWERRARGGGEAGGGGGARGKGWHGRGHRKEKIGTGSASIISSRTPRVGLAERGTRTHRSRVEKRVGLILCSKKKLLERGPGPPPNPAESGSEELFSAHKSLQEDPKRFLDASKTIQEADKMSRDCSRRPINGPRRILDEPKLDPEASKIRISLFWCGFAEAKSNKNRSRNVYSFKRAYKPKNTIFLV